MLTRRLGDGVPGSAISLRLQRLRSMAKKGDTADAAAPTTPTKKRTAAASSSSTPRKRAKTVGVKKEQSNTEMDVHTSPVAETPARALDSVGKRMSKPTFKKVEKNFSIFEDGEDTADSKGHSVSDHDSDNSEYVNGSVVTDDGVTNDSVA